MRLFLALLALFVGAFVLRVGFTAAFRGGLGMPPDRSVNGADGVEYELFGRRVAAGQGYTWADGTPTAFRAPGLPLALAGVYTVFGDRYTAAYLSLAAWGAAGAVAAFLLGDELLGRRGGWAAGAVAAVYPADVFFCSYFFSEVVYAPLLGLGLLALARCARTGRLGWAAAGGLALGLSTLCRSFGLLFLPVFGLYLLARGGRGWAAAGLFAVGFLAPVAPWSARNYTVFGRPVLVATNGGSTFYGGNNPVVAGTLGQYGNWVATNGLPGRAEIEAQPDEVSHDKKEWELGLRWVRENPLQFAKLAPFKLARFWSPFVSYPSLKVYPVANIGLVAPFLGLISLGICVTLWRRDGRRRFALLHLTMLANLVMVVIFWGDPRFRDANVPVLAVYAAAGVGAVAGRRAAAEPPAAA